MHLPSVCTRTQLQHDNKSDNKVASRLPRCTPPRRPLRRLPVSEVYERGLSEGKARRERDGQGPSGHHPNTTDCVLPELLLNPRCPLCACDLVQRLHSTHTRRIQVDQRTQGTLSKFVCPQWAARSTRRTCGSVWQRHCQSQSLRSLPGGRLEPRGRPKRQFSQTLDLLKRMAHRMQHQQHHKLLNASR